MRPAPLRHQVEMCSMQLSECGSGFVMDLANSARESIRLEFPDWILHQLMRMLPRIDAALQRPESGGPGSLIAYPLAEWNVVSAGPGQGVALHLRNDHQVDAAFHLSPEAALRLHRELGAALGLTAATVATTNTAPQGEPAAAAR